MIDIYANCNIYPYMRQKDIYERVGKNLAARRNELKRTQSYVACKSGISRPSLANIETGNQTITLHQLYKLAAALELNDARQLLPAGVTTIEEQKMETKDVKIENASRLNPDHISEIREVIAAWGNKK